MKTIMRKVTNEVPDYVEAEDGEKFYICCGSLEKAQEECREYENSCRGILAKRVMQIPHIETSEYDLYNFGDDDRGVYLFLPQSKEDIEALNKLSYNIDSKYGDQLEENNVNKVISVALGCEETWANASWLSMKTLEKDREEFLESLETHEKKLRKLANKTGDSTGGN